MRGHTASADKSSLAVEIPSKRTPQTTLGKRSWIQIVPGWPKCGAGQIWSTFIVFGSITVGRFRADSGQVRATFGRLLATLGRFRGIVGLVQATSGRYRPSLVEFGRCRPNICQFGANLLIRSIPDHLLDVGRAKFGQYWPNFGRIPAASPTQPTSTGIRRTLRNVDRIWPEFAEIARHCRNLRGPRAGTRIEQNNAQHLRAFDCCELPIIKGISRSGALAAIYRHPAKLGGVGVAHVCGPRPQACVGVAWVPWRK